jgi:type IV pilus assembly protein PilC
MLNFEYKGISLGKYVEGEIEALNSAEAAHKLKDQKVIITKLKETKKKIEKVKKKSTSFIFGTGVTSQEILIFCKQFATMLRAGLPVLNTLQMLELQTKRPGMKRVIQAIKKDLESGNSLSKCFELHPKIFDTVVVNLIKAGEASGKLDTFLQKIVINLEKNAKIKAQIKSALFYPAVLFIKRTAG